jgi:hypothetical protein
MPQDLSLAHAFRAPETQEISVHETRSSTRVVFIKLNNENLIFFCLFLYFRRKRRNDH